jgi:hypothetical protein
MAAAVVGGARADPRTSDANADHSWSWSAGDLQTSDANADHSWSSSDEWDLELVGRVGFGASRASGICGDLDECNAASDGCGRYSC